MEKVRNHKTLSIIIPCYNGAHFLENCVYSILGEKIDHKSLDILIINDGSTDDTQVLGEAIQKRFPDCVRIIQQANKGHGGAINTGLGEAQGTYVKVVDCDDWLDTDAFDYLLNQINALNEAVDMLLANFMYDKVGSEKKRIMDYRGLIPIETVCSWRDIKPFPAHKYILMHSIIYRTELLKTIDLKLPEHCFYVDNLFAFEPLPHVKTIYYVDRCLYHYHIGRDDQSVNLNNMLRRIDQQLFVNKRMIDLYQHTFTSNGILPKQVLAYGFHYLKTITMVSMTLLVLKNDGYAQIKQNDLWAYLDHAKLKQKMKQSLMGRLFHLPGKLKVWIPRYLYRIAQKQIGFN